MVEQLPHCDLLRLILLTERFVLSARQVFPQSQKDFFLFLYFPMAMLSFSEKRVSEKLPQQLLASACTPIFFLLSCFSMAMLSWGGRFQSSKQTGVRKVTTSELQMYFLSSRFSLAMLSFQVIFRLKQRWCQKSYLPFSYA